MSSFDVYTDANPKDTIPIKYATLSDVKKTIRTLEKLYKNKSYSHTRIFQVANIMNIRLRFLDKPAEQKEATRYVEFLKKRTKLSEVDRYKLKY